MSAPVPLSERAALWAAHYATPSGFRFMPAEELVRFCGRHGSLGRVLEVGCGNGANLWFLAEHSDSVVGVDCCDHVLVAARALCERRGVSPSVTLMPGDALDLPLVNGSFDVVVDAMVGQHLSWDEHRTLFAEYRRVLRPGGLAFVYHLVSGTTGGAPGTRDYPFGIGLFPAAGRVCLPTSGELADRLRASGFVGVEERGMTRTYPDGDRACYAVLEGTAQ